MYDYFYDEYQNAGYSDTDSEYAAYRTVDDIFGDGSDGGSSGGGGGYYGGGGDLFDIIGLAVIVPALLFKKAYNMTMSNRITTCNGKPLKKVLLLTLFLGLWGVHNLYIGNKKRGWQELIIGFAFPFTTFAMFVVDVHDIVKLIKSEKEAAEAINSDEWNIPSEQEAGVSA